jgi:hypothetical protein
MAHDKEFEAADRRGQRMQGSLPRAIAVRYDRKTGLIVVTLSSKLIVAFSPRDAQGLENARPSQLQRAEITPSGFGIHFPDLDSDLYVPGLLEGFLGSRKWMAARLGRAGGTSKSRLKREAARANGKLGGRPRKASGA